MNQPGNSVYVCYEENGSDLAREAGAINELTLFYSKDSRDDWVKARLEQAYADDFFVDEEIGGDEMLSSIIAKDEDIDITLFRGEQENWNESYGIIVRKMEIQ